MGFTMRERKAVTKETLSRYRRADKKSKGKILEEFIHLTGYACKYAIGLLNSVGRPRRERPTGGGKRERPRRYEGRVLKVLIRIWYLFGCMCGKRIAPIIRMNLRVLEKFGELQVDERLRARLLIISAATIDQLLWKERKRMELKGRFYTKPGSLRKHQIPIRTFGETN